MRDKLLGNAQQFISHYLPLEGVGGGSKGSFCQTPLA